MNTVIYIFAGIGAVGMVSAATVLVAELWAVRRDRGRTRAAREGSPRSPVPRQAFYANGDGGSISDVVKHFEDLYR